MRAYVISTGAVFGVIAALHVWRVAMEPHLARDPAFIAVTIVAVALALWAWRVSRSVTRP